MNLNSSSAKQIISTYHEGKNYLTTSYGDNTFFYYLDSKNLVKPKEQFIVKDDYIGYQTLNNINPIEKILSVFPYRTYNSTEDCIESIRDLIFKIGYPFDSLNTDEGLIIKNAIKDYSNIYAYFLLMQCMKEKLNTEKYLINTEDLCDILSNIFVLVKNSGLKAFHRKSEDESLASFNPKIGTASFDYETNDNYISSVDIDYYVMCALAKETAMKQNHSSTVTEEEIENNLSNLYDTLGRYSGEYEKSVIDIAPTRVFAIKNLIELIVHFDLIDDILSNFCPPLDLKFWIDHNDGFERKFWLNPGYVYNPNGLYDWNDSFFCHVLSGYDNKIVSSSYSCFNNYFKKIVTEEDTNIFNKKILIEVIQYVLSEIAEPYITQISFGINEQNTISLEFPTLASMIYYSMNCMDYSKINLRKCASSKCNNFFFVNLAKQGKRATYCCTKCARIVSNKVSYENKNSDLEKALNDWINTKTRKNNTLEEFIIWLNSNQSRSSKITYITNKFLKEAFIQKKMDRLYSIQDINPIINEIKKKELAAFTNSWYEQTSTTRDHRTVKNYLFFITGKVELPTYQYTKYLTEDYLYDLFYKKENSGNPLDKTLVKIKEERDLIITEFRKAELKEIYDNWTKSLQKKSIKPDVASFKLHLEGSQRNPKSTKPLSQYITDDFINSYFPSPCSTSENNVNDESTDRPEIPVI